METVRNQPAQVAGGLASVHTEEDWVAGDRAGGFVLNALYELFKCVSSLGGN